MNIPTLVPPTAGDGARVRAFLRAPPRAPRLLAVAGLAALVWLSCSPASHEAHLLTHALGAPAQEGPEPAVEVPPPPFSEGIFPCSDCHDPEIPVNTQPRKLAAAHQEIELRHDEQHRWCLDCHDAANRDVLHLASGAPVEFSESYKLCGQCHGDKYRDWRAGVHGRRSGSWNGDKTYLLCVHCHNAHSPAFQPLQPKPPPVSPSQSLRSEPRGGGASHP